MNNSQEYSGYEGEEILRNAGYKPKVGDALWFYPSPNVKQLAQVLYIHPDGSVDLVWQFAKQVKAGGPDQPGTYGSPSPILTW